MKKELKVGQQVWLVNIGNDARNKPSVATPATVTKVGKKYFYVKGAEGTFYAYSEIAFDKKDWHQVTEYSSNVELYETQQEFLDKVEKARICHFIWDAFEYGSNQRNLTLETLRKIKELIELGSAGD
jgi:hypothetical protein